MRHYFIHQEEKPAVLSGGWHGIIPFQTDIEFRWRALCYFFNSEFFQGLVFSCKLDFEIFLLVSTVKDI